MNSVHSVLIPLAAIYVLITVFVYLIQDGLLFYPSPSDAEIEARYREYAISVETGEVVLHGWFIPAAEHSHPTIAFYGGNGQELSTSIASIRALGDYNFVMINYRGYGRSSGRPSEKVLKSDALFILDALEAEKRISLHNTIVLGRSLGTGVATHVAANREIKGLILISPFDSIEAIAADIYFFLPVRWLIKNPFRSIDYIPAISASTLVIKAEHDQVVPERYTDELIKAWKSPLTVIKLEGTNHNYIETPRYFDEINRFLLRLGSQNVQSPSTR